MSITTTRLGNVRVNVQHDLVACLTESVELTSSFWRKTLVFSALVVAFYKFAPTPGQDVYLTTWLAKFSTPRDVWESRNAKHLLLAQQASAETLLTSDARRSTVHRYRYPQSFEQVSPHLSPLGGVVDLQGLVVKGDKE